MEKASPSGSASNLHRGARKCRPETNLFMCRCCQDVFQARGKENCFIKTYTNTSSLVYENDEACLILGYKLWKTKQIKTYKSNGEEIPTRWEFYQKWKTLDHLEKDIWISAGETVQFCSHVNTFKSQEYSKQALKTLQHNEVIPAAEKPGTPASLITTPKRCLEKGMEKMRNTASNSAKRSLIGDYEYSSLLKRNKSIPLISTKTNKESQSLYESGNNTNDEKKELQCLPNVSLFEPPGDFILDPHTGEYTPDKQPTGQNETAKTPRPIIIKPIPIDKLTNPSTLAKPKFNVEPMYPTNVEPINKKDIDCTVSTNATMQPPADEELLIANVLWKQSGPGTNVTVFLALPDGEVMVMEVTPEQIVDLGLE